MGISPLYPRTESCQTTPLLCAGLFHGTRNGLDKSLQHKTTLLDFVSRTDFTGSYQYLGRARLCFITTGDCHAAIFVSPVQNIRQGGEGVW
jgi:hypothetical protein